MNSTADYNKVERGKSSPNDDDEVSSNEEGFDGKIDPNKGKKFPQWQRVKWTSSMVRLLITAVSYLTDDAMAMAEGFPRGRRKYLNLQKKGKWKSISKVMAERGSFVSPQQCEDKFNDLNKRYKKLNDILGKGTSCQVVEKPALLDMMDHLSDKLKDEVRKILSSKHLFYEELCSYHNNNRLHLPHDLPLQQSLQLALKSRDDDDAEPRRHLHDDVEDDHDADSDDHEDYRENCTKGEFSFGESSKRSRYTQDYRMQSQSPCVDMQLSNTESHKSGSMQKQWLKSQSVQLEEQRLQIELETLELEKQRFKWERFCNRKDRELEKLKTENDRMKLENERIALELKRAEMSMNSKS
ncbi:Myb/SANT-like DNA-binding domain-containing protein 4 [Bienertia sinuspersici]